MASGVYTLELSYDELQLIHAGLTDLRMNILRRERPDNALVSNIDDLGLKVAGKMSLHEATQTKHPNDDVERVVPNAADTDIEAGNVTAAESPEKLIESLDAAPTEPLPTAADSEFAKKKEPQPLVHRPKGGKQSQKPARPQLGDEEIVPK